MHDTIPASKQIESFMLSLADIQEVALDKLHALSLSVRWPHRSEDWAFLRQVGHGLAALDDIGRVMATAMWFPQGDGFATVGMVITSPRLQTLGAGYWLMQHVLQRVQGRTLGLSATRVSERLYASLGFTPHMIVRQHQGEARALQVPVAVRVGTVRELGAADLAQIREVDRMAAGIDRGALLAALLPRSTILGLFRNEKLAAFAFGRVFGRGTVIGPVVACCDADAVAVVTPHVAQHAGLFVRVDTRQAEGGFDAWLTSAGLPVFDTVTSMVLGQARMEGQPSIYGLITQATG